MVHIGLPPPPTTTTTPPPPPPPPPPRADAPSAFGIGGNADASRSIVSINPPPPPIFSRRYRGMMKCPTTDCRLMYPLQMCHPTHGIPMFSLTKRWLVQAVGRVTDSHRERFCLLFTQVHALSLFCSTRIEIIQFKASPLVRCRKACHKARGYSTHRHMLGPERPEAV